MTSSLMAPVRSAARRTAIRTTSALGVAALLAAALTACSDQYDSTTCGEYLDMSESEQVQFTKDAIESQATEEELAEFETLGEEIYTLTSGALADQCEGEDPDATLGEISENLAG